MSANPRVDIVMGARPGLVLVPNPFRSAQKIVVPDLLVHVRANLQIFSIDGRLLRSLDFEGRDNSGMTWNGSDLKPGVYLVKLKHGRASYTGKSVVIE
jgi:hypothetical protein